MLPRLPATLKLSTRFTRAALRLLATLWRSSLVTPNIFQLIYLKHSTFPKLHFPVSCSPVP